MLKAFIVDDEPAVNATLQAMLQEFCPGVLVSGYAFDIFNALPHLIKDDIDVLFLDINLGSNTTGFDLLGMLQQYTFDVVLVTAHEHHALRSYDFDGIVQYLLKPVSHMKLISTITRIEQKRRNSKMMNTSNAMSDPIPYIALTDTYQTMLVSHNDIMYIAGNGSYCTFYFKDGTSNQQSRHLKYFEEMLALKPDFIRIHKSYIVNRNYIKGYLKETLKILLVGNIQLPTSLSNKEFIQKMGIL